MLRCLDRRVGVQMSIRSGKGMLLRLACTSRRRGYMRGCTDTMERKRRRRKQTSRLLVTDYQEMVIKEERRKLLELGRT